MPDRLNEIVDQRRDDAPGQIMETCRIIVIFGRGLELPAPTRIGYGVDQRPCHGLGLADELGDLGERRPVGIEVDGPGAAIDQIARKPGAPLLGGLAPVGWSLGSRWSASCGCYEGCSSGGGRAGCGLSQSQA
jgi:hypothetical protein